MTRVVVYGAGGHAKVVADILERDPSIELVGWLDDDRSRHGRAWFGHPVLGGRERIGTLLADGVRHAVVAVGDNAVRDRIAGELEACGMAFATAVHPSAQLGRGVVVGAGAAIMAGVVVNADTVIGEHAIVNTGATVDHDARLGRAVHVGPGAHLGGGVSVGDLALVALGASVVLNVTVGARAVIGAGAVVIGDVAADTLVVGVPARAVRR